MGTAVAYLRRSRVDTKRTGAISYEQQLNAVQGLARLHGDDALTIIEDWGKSGRASKQHLRAGYARLEAMLNAGEVSAIYAYSANRLARSLEVLARLAKTCAAAGVPIRCADGYSPDVTTSTGRMVLGILGSVYQWQAEWTAERASEGTEIRRSRGDHIGPAPYGYRVRGGKLVKHPGEDVGVVVSAFETAGSYLGAARLLTYRAIKPQRGTTWAASAVKSILTKQAPEVVPNNVRRGRKPAQSFILAGLLRCRCGATLTAGHYRGDRVAYNCHRAAETPGHGRPVTITEPKLIDWVRAEATRLRVPGSAAELPVDLGRMDTLADKRSRYIEMYGEGLIDKAGRDAKLAEIVAEMDELAASTVLETVPTAVDWSWPTTKLNVVLRALWRWVELDGAMRPVRAEWTVPLWRSE